MPVGMGAADGVTVLVVLAGGASPAGAEVVVFETELPFEPGVVVDS